jgi:hypothetical protein
VRLPQCLAVQVVACGQRALEIRQPNVLAILVQAAAVVLDGDVHTYRDRESVVGPQPVPRVVLDAVSEELIVIAAEQRVLQPSPIGDGPVKNCCVDQIVDAEPGGQAPVERLPVDEIERSGSRVRGTRMFVQPGSPWMIVNPLAVRGRSIMAAG